MLGGLVSTRDDRFRLPDVDVRVGSYRFDNTNYVGSDLAFGSRYALGRFPLEDVDGVLRISVAGDGPRLQIGARGDLPEARGAEERGGERADRRFCEGRTGAPAGAGRAGGG